MEKSEIESTNIQNRADNYSYKLDEFDFMRLEQIIDSLKEEIEDVSATLICKTQFVCNKTEKRMQDFWQESIASEEVTGADIINYAELYNLLNEASKFNDDIACVYNEAARLLEDLKIVLKHLQ